MKILISPAKSISSSKDIHNKDYTIPNFLNTTEIINNKLKKLSIDDISSLMNVSDKIALLNETRNKIFEKEHNISNSKQVIYIFDGIVYKRINPYNMNTKQIEYLQNNLFILSGFYGILKPLDIIQPYRLEMGTNIEIGKNKNLYNLWSKKLTEFMNKEENEVIINLASNEYFKVLNKKNITSKIITPIFKDFKNGKLKTIAIFAKQARGLMVKFMAENNIINYNDLKSFDLEGYKFEKNLSNEKEFIFIR